MGTADLEGCDPSQPRNPLWALFLDDAVINQQSLWPATGYDVQVHPLLSPFGFAASQLAVFQGASEASIPHHFYPLAI